MAWSGYILLLNMFFIITGAVNTIVYKCADNTESINRDGKISLFNHPFMQTLFMFFGELLNMLLFLILYRKYSRRGDGSEQEHILTKGNTKYNKFLLLLPSALDTTASCVENMGLVLTYATSSQMFRGTIIVFVAMLSIIFLKRRITKFGWLGIFLVVFGLVLVGIADLTSVNTNPGDYGAYSVIIGDALSVVAQLIVAIQLVIEEKLLLGKDIPPLQAVGYEGVFGSAITVLMLIPFYFIPVPQSYNNNPRNVVEDAYDAAVQISNSYQLIIFIIAGILSISIYNFAGISITKELSATTRKVLDSLRTAIIWIVSMAAFGQKFHWLQLIGFLIMVTGTITYTEGFVVIWKKCRKRIHKTPEESSTDKQEGADKTDEKNAKK